MKRSSQRIVTFADQAAPQRVGRHIELIPWFGSLAEAAWVIEAWGQNYNRERPHSALGYEPPEQLAHRLGALGLDEVRAPRRRSLRRRAHATT